MTIDYHDKNNNNKHDQPSWPGVDGDQWLFHLLCFARSAHLLLLSFCTSTRADQSSGRTVVGYAYYWDRVQEQGGTIRLGMNVIGCRDVG
jgi:hypothetical protein